MAEVDATQPTNGGAENVVDDAEEAESQVRSYLATTRTSSNLVIFSQEIMLMKQRVAEMEMEAKKLRELQAEAEASQQKGQEAAMETDEDKNSADGRSVYVGNVSPVFIFCQVRSHLETGRL